MSRGAEYDREGPYLDRGPAVKHAGGLEVEQAKLWHQLERLNKCTSVLSDSITSLQDKVAPLTSPPDVMSALAAPSDSMAQDRIQASELVNQLWDLVNQLEHQIFRLKTTTEGIEL